MNKWGSAEWWDNMAEVDIATAAKAFEDEGLPFLYWENRVPLFDGEVDHIKVQEIVLGLMPDESDSGNEALAAEQAQADVALADDKKAPKPKPRKKKK